MDAYMQQGSDYDGVSDTPGTSTISTQNGPTENRLLWTLEQLLTLDNTSITSTLSQASDLLATALGSEKLDAFLFDPSSSTLVAVGTSHTPMGILQHKLGLHILPLANGGPEAGVFQTGKTFHTGALDQDPAVPVGMIRELGIRSMIAVPLVVNGERRGVLQGCSAEYNAFTQDDLDFLSAAAHWIGTITHRAELVESIAQTAAEQARQLVAEELIMVLAHDLRNYLSPLKGRIDIIRQRARREGRERDLKDGDAAARAVNRLQTLIQDLLDIGRLDQGIFTITPEVVDLVALAQDTVALLQTNQVNIVLNAPDELVAEVDPARIRQALDNLVANAVKHSPRGSTIEIEISTQNETGILSLPPEGGNAIIFVRDQGSGIPPEMLPRIFDRFVTGPESKGLGLGLYIARSIAEAHNGTLTVDSTVGMGTTFQLCFPLLRHNG